MSLQSSIHNLSQSSNTAVFKNRIDPITPSDQSTPKIPEVPTQTVSSHPKIKQNVYYIVSVTIFNSTFTHVVLVKEAKPSCFNKLYLPAGKVEPNENLIEAAKREVLEEAGIVDVELTTLVSIEEQGVRWLRFNFVGKIRDETTELLKSVPDKETLSAEWYPVESVLELNDLFKNRKTLNREQTIFKKSFRCLDILSTIQEAYQISKHVIPQNIFIKILPNVGDSYENCSVRLIMSCKTEKTTYFIATEHSNLLPEVLIPIRPTVEDLVSERVMNYMQTCIIGDWSKNHEKIIFAGIVGVHHSGKNGCDGIRFDAVFEFTGEELPKISADMYSWVEVGDGSSRVLDLVKNHGLYAPALKHA